jgi:hypothetical protein
MHWGRPAHRLPGGLSAAGRGRLVGPLRAARRTLPLSSQVRRSACTRRSSNTGPALSAAATPPASSVASSGPASIFSAATEATKVSDPSGLAAHAGDLRVQLSVVAPGACPGPPAGGPGLGGEKSDSLRLYCLLRLHDVRRQPASAFLSPASIFSAASSCMPGWNAARDLRDHASEDLTYLDERAREFDEACRHELEWALGYAGRLEVRQSR